MAKLISGTRIYGNTAIDTYLTLGSNVSISGANAATSNITGAITVVGGIGIRGNVYAGSVILTGSGNTITFPDGTTQSSGAASAGVYANTAYLHANSSYLSQNSSGQYANSAYGVANSASSYANGAFQVANSASSYANGAFQAANSAGSYANSAYTKANNALANSTGTFSGDLTISGNLVVQGTSITVNVSSLAVNDSIILLGSNNSLDAVDIGFVGHYAANNIHTGLIRHAADDTYYLFKKYPLDPFSNVIDVANNQFTIATLKANLLSDVVTIRGYDPINHTNTAYGVANSASSYANGAFTAANTADQRAVTSGSYSNSAYTFANTANGYFYGVNAQQNTNITSASSYANGAFTAANTADQRAVTSGSYANSAYTQANTATTNAATADQRAVTSGSYANSAFGVANSASSYANGAFTYANTRYSSSGGTISGNVVVSNNFTVSTLTAGRLPYISTAGLIQDHANLTYNVSTGEMQATAIVATAGIVVNSNTVTANYTIATGTNGLTVGPVSINPGVTVTLSSGQVWLIL